jgi:hypothetical protein
MSAIGHLQSPSFNHQTQVTLQRQVEQRFKDSLDRTLPSAEHAYHSSTAAAEA